MGTSSTSFKKGNTLWMLRTMPTGPKKKYGSAEQLWSASVSYFKWVEDNPITTMFYQGKVYDEPVKINRPMMTGGLCTHPGISRRTWYNYKSSNKPDMLHITSMIENIIIAQCIEGALVGIFKPNIIAYQLRLIEDQKYGKR